MYPRTCMDAWSMGGRQYSSVSSSTFVGSSASRHSTQKSVPNWGEKRGG
jgi:hypothetical protein